MKKLQNLLVCLLLALTTSSMAQSSGTITISNDIQLHHLADSIYVHETWITNQNGRFPCNGVIVIKQGKAVMIDTPIDDETTKELTEYLQNKMRVELTKLIIGHHHIDCMGGLTYIQEQGIESIACALTIDTCKKLDLPIPSTSFKEQYEVDLNGLELQCRFLGGGHTFDNILVWIPENKILFGGCLIKETAQRNLYELTDTEADEWQETVSRIIDTFPDVQIVVPGHGASGGKELLTHTIKLVEANRQ